MPRPTSDNSPVWHPNVPRLKVSKQEIVKREIETCSDLYFSFGDLVSMHVLVNAAHEILSAYDDANSKTGTIFNDIKEGVRSELRQALQQPYRAFKHGKKDLNEVTELPADLTEILMLSAIAKYEEIVGNITPKMVIFRVWMGAQYHLLTAAADIKYKADWIREHFPVTARDKFRDEFLPLLLNAQPAADWGKLFGGN
jgi:hypothetical protein